MNAEAIYIDTNNPIHAEAFLIAAGHFLSNWPQDWDAERLSLALIADEDSDEQQQEDQKQIEVWEVIANHELHPMDDGNPFDFIHELIDNLAGDFVAFATKHSKQ